MVLEETPEDVALKKKERLKRSIALNLSIYSTLPFVALD